MDSEETTSLVLYELATSAVDLGHLGAEAYKNGDQSMGF